MIKKVMLVITILFSLSFAIEFPFSSWGQLSYTDGELENGVECSGYFEQGIDWAKYKVFSFNTFVGIKPSISDNVEYYWKNKTSHSIGLKIKQNLNFGKKFWGGVDYGFKYECNNYYSNDKKFIDGTNSFLNFGFGGSWGKNNKSFLNNFPLSSWMSLNFINGEIKESDVVFSGCIQQGVTLYSINKYNLNSFAGYRFTHSDNEDRWNNKIGIISGIEINRPLSCRGSWGNLALDLQYELYNYTKTDKSNDSQVIILFKWGFGGNLEKISTKGKN
jgi:hypothetical protein